MAGIATDFKFKSLNDLFKLIYMIVNTYFVYIFIILILDFLIQNTLDRLHE